MRTARISRVLMSTRVVLMSGRRGTMDGTGMRLRAGHCKAEYQRQDHPDESHAPNIPWVGWGVSRERRGSLGRAGQRGALIRR